ncbi:M1 family metallopeptidase [Rheinheimera maricola]|uniref:M1 family metallopeptidase n=1 Tax=Rheinheimera maricola TaxID=2793282 RepID=A0ABS7X7T4_9GAMM|nr:M1 family metallopeptidase [Rheinheimera maricola]MBZ9611599.1 M1 family metallopeptidase [Rheinheimera maricola]
MKNRLLVSVILCFSFTYVVHADLFAPLPLPLPAGSSSTGVPSQQYWQQQVDYRISAELNPDSAMLNASADITYKNNSPQPLGQLWFELPLNRFLPDSISTALHGEGSGSAGITQISFSAAAQPLPLLRQDTFYRVSLPQPLAPGQSISLALQWQLQLPERTDPRRPRAGVERFGDGSKLFGVALWFPRAVAFTANGWALSPFIKDAEFATELGDYQLNLSLPADYLVLASGELQNAKQVLTKAQYQAWQRQGSAQLLQVKPDAAAGSKTWQFSAVGVRDVAFAAGNSLIWHTEQLQLNGSWHRLNVAYPDNGRWLWHKYALASTRHSVQQLAQYFGEFPFNAMNVVNIAGIGMEYPGITFVGFRGPDAPVNGPAPAYSRTEKHDVLGGIMHEVAHSYFPMLVNTDERQEGFFDEGMVSFLSYLLEQSWSTDFQSFYGDPAGVGAVMANSDYAAPVRRADHFSAKLDSHYHVPAVAWVILRQHIVGPELFDATLRDFVSQWRGKRAQFADLIRFFHAQTGQDLHWFWRGWFYSANHVDMALSSITRDDKMLTVMVDNLGGIVMPFNLKLTFSDGSIAERAIPVDIWRLDNKQAKVRVTLPVTMLVKTEPLKAELAVLADAELRNNQLPVN